MATILAVGIATLDIINSLDSYPAEDDKVRALSQRISRGGNATNTLVVLSQLGHHCYWAGTLADEPDARHIEDDLARYRIDCSAVLQLEEGKVPTSYIIHNRSNGSRTIVNYRDLPEYPFSAFAEIDLNQLDWLHFEGRNVIETRQMLKLAKSQRPDLHCSVEIEKERDEIETLLPLADVLLFSKTLARGRGYTEATTLLKAMRPLAPQALLVCAWGEQGAWAMDHDDVIHHSPAFPPDKVIDTLAAGDTFNAGLIDALCQGLDVQDALTAACQLAGRKIGHHGLAFLNKETRS